jgi:hypothetical protein
MEMVLVWKDAKSFKQHIADMRMFSLLHRHNLQGVFNLLKNMPTSCNFPPVGSTGGGIGFISNRGKSTLVPIWEIELPRGSQN